MENIKGIAMINIKVKKAGTDKWIDMGTSVTDDIKLIKEE